MSELAEPDAETKLAETDEPWPTKVQGQNDRDIFILCALVLLLTFSFEATPARDGITVYGVRLPEICGMKRMGWGDCPGCGLTRSFVLGSRLNPEAFALHPAGPLLLLVVAGQLPFRGWRWYRRRSRRRQGLVDLEHERYEPFWRVFRWGLVGAVLGGWLFKLWLRA
jgi:hypothetical protein